MFNTDGRPTLHNCQSTIMKSLPTITYRQVCPRQNESALESADSGDLFKQEAAGTKGRSRVAVCFMSFWSHRDSPEEEMEIGAPSRE